MKKIVTAAALAASLFAATAANATTLVNGGFEASPVGSGTVPTAWSSNRPANVQVVNSIFGYNPLEGSNFAAIASPNALNLATTLFRQIDLNAGDILSFVVAFYTTESTVGTTTFNDNGTVGIFNLDLGLASTTLFAQSVNGLPQSVSGGTGTPWTLVSFTAPDTGTYQVTARVANIGDTAVPSYLLLDQFDVAAVPEPGTWMLMLLGFGAMGFAMRRRQKSQVRFQFA
jgi:hypothetical protein